LQGGANRDDDERRGNGQSADHDDAPETTNDTHQARHFFARQIRGPGNRLQGSTKLLHRKWINIRGV
jgi:hypothetical protein